MSRSPHCVPTWLSMSAWWAPPRSARLNAHSVQFTAEAGGTWNYSVVLTQNLNRGAISQGQLRFVVEGVRPASW